MQSDPLQRVVINSSADSWHAYPDSGMERIDLETEESTTEPRTTSLIKYDPGSTFAEHTYEYGEELFVLEGAFDDEMSRYSAGTYLHNPPGFSSTPRLCRSGCLLFVKQQQLKPHDSERTIIRTPSQPWLSGLVPGLQVMPLHQFETEHTALVKWAPHTRFNLHRHWGGEEILVLEGVFRDEHGTYPEHTWIRSPHMSQHAPFTDAEGCTILVKTGHL